MPPLSLAHVQLLVDADLARVPAERLCGGTGDLGQGSTTIFGQVYAHNGGSGVASYHFDEAGAYISYENALSSVFPALDDGTRPPARKFFENPAMIRQQELFEAMSHGSLLGWVLIAGSMK